MMRDSISLLGLLLLLNSGYLSAVEKAVDFAFGSPKVVKLDWSTRSLTPTDLNGDGLRDVALINNDSGKIELLYQLPQGESALESKKAVNRSRWEPVLEDALFEKRALTVGYTVFDMVVHDFNGDGLVDLAYTSSEVPLTIRYQNEDGEWVDSWEYDDFEAMGWTSTIKASDVDGDGLVELFVLSADAIRVFKPGPEGSYGEPQLFYISGENPFNLMLFDASGDGLPDLHYLCSDGRQVLAMRQQIYGGNFGPESRFVLERPARIMVPLDSVGDKPNSLGMVNARSGSLEFMRLAPGGNKSSGEVSALKQASPEIYPIFNKVRESASYALGDVDGDGEEDLIVANPAEAELVLFTKRRGSFQASRAFPSFSAVSSLSIGRFFADSRERLVVLSENEKTLGLSELDSRGRLTFPRQLKIGEGDPVVTTALDLD
ncbi:MAG: FG-GAP and VCBS repeat-containing protein, partial [Opitutales bacterium]